MQFLKSHVWGSGRRSPGGWIFFCSSVVKAQLDAACTAAQAGWSQLARPRMSTTGNACARLLREEGDKMAQQAKC